MATLWVVWLVCGWFVGSLARLWVVWVVCDWFDWFVDGLWVVWVVCGWFGWFGVGLAGLWVVSSFTANGAIINRPGKKYIIYIWNKVLIKVQQLLIKVPRRIYWNILRSITAKYNHRKKIRKYLLFA